MHNPSSSKAPQALQVSGGQCSPVCNEPSCIITWNPRCHVCPHTSSNRPCTHVEQCVCTGAAQQHGPPSIHTRIHACPCTQQLTLQPATEMPPYGIACAGRSFIAACRAQAQTPVDTLQRAATTAVAAATTRMASSLLPHSTRPVTAQCSRQQPRHMSMASLQPAARAFITPAAAGNPWTRPHLHQNHPLHRQQQPVMCRASIHHAMSGATTGNRHGLRRKSTVAAAAAAGRRPPVEDLRKDFDGKYGNGSASLIPEVRGGH